MIIMRDNKILWFFAGLALFLLLTSCSPIQSPPQSGADLPAANLPEKTVFIDATGLQAAKTPLPEEATPVLAETAPKEPVQPVDIEMPPANFKEFKPVDLARADLAAKMDADIDSISVIFVSEAALEEASCELEIPQQGARLFLHGERVQVILELKKNTYTYWVFSQEDDSPVAVPCK